MNIPSVKEIQADIYKLVGEREKCKLGAEALEEHVKELRKEQDELRVLLDNPGPYDVEALGANIKRIDNDAIRSKCQSDMMSRLTGMSPLES